MTIMLRVVDARGVRFVSAHPQPADALARARLTQPRDVATGRYSVPQPNAEMPTAAQAPGIVSRQSGAGEDWQRVVQGDHPMSGSIHIRRQ
jgi:hypothetical protein